MTDFASLRALIPASMLDVSGVVFSSGQSAFSNPSPLYVLGLNPGGSPDENREETLRSHTEMVANAAPDWLSFSDQSIKGKKAGTYGFQPRVLHVLEQTGLNPRSVPASNLVFVRSRREKDIAGQLDSLAEQCWPFHRQVIEGLGVKVVLCFGSTAARWLRRKLGAVTQPIDSFTEENMRRWTSRAYAARTMGLTIIAATHPSIANWANTTCDPTPLVARALAAAKSSG